MSAQNQTLEFLATLMKNVPWGTVHSKDLQKWIDDPQRLAIELPKFLKNFPQDVALVEAKPDPILRRLFEDETITIAPCDGSRYIGKQEKTFTAGIDGDFKRWNLNNRGKSTDAANVSVLEMIKDATFVQMFGSLGSDLDKLCLGQDQIIKFCETNRDKLRKDGYATFFLFKENENFFVACVHVDSDGLDVLVAPFEHDGVWDAGAARRVVTPQLTV